MQAIKSMGVALDGINELRRLNILKGAKFCSEGGQVRRQAGITLIVATPFMEIRSSVRGEGTIDTAEDSIRRYPA